VSVQKVFGRDFLTMCQKSFCDCPMTTSSCLAHRTLNVYLECPIYGFALPCVRAKKKCLEWNQSKGPLRTGEISLECPTTTSSCLDFRTIILLNLTGKTRKGIVVFLFLLRVWTLKIVIACASGSWNYCFAIKCWLLLFLHFRRDNMFSTVVLETFLLFSFWSLHFDCLPCFSGCWMLFCQRCSCLCCLFDNRDSKGSLWNNHSTAGGLSAKKIRPRVAVKLTYNEIDSQQMCTQNKSSMRRIFGVPSCWSMDMLSQWNWLTTNVHTKHVKHETMHNANWQWMDGLQLQGLKRHSKSLKRLHAHL